MLTKADSGCVEKKTTEQTMSFRLLTKAWRQQIQPLNRTEFSSYILHRSFSRVSERFVITETNLISLIISLLLLCYPILINDLLIRPSFGIAFDIDGVILLGNTPVGGSPAALRKLYNYDGK